MDIYIAKNIRKAFLNEDSLEQYKEFKLQYPKLYDMITSYHCNELMLEKFLEMFTKVQKKELTRDEADVEFGKIAASVYLPENLH